MRKSLEALSLLSLFILLEAIFWAISPVSGAPYAGLEIERVLWGSSDGTEITVKPGDADVPLTLNVRNRSNYTLNGIYATLYLNKSVNGIYLFTNTSGGLEANAVGQALQMGDIRYQTGEVLPGTAFSLTFSLNINPDAKPGSYYYPMKIDYLVNQSGIIIVGEPRTLDAIITLFNRAPIIDSFTPMNTNPTVYVGDSMNFSAVCHDPDGDSLTYRWTLDGVTVANSCWFIYSPFDRDVGSHTVELRASDGNLFASQTWTISVDKIRTTTISLSSNYLTGGLENPVNMTLRNNLWEGTVQVQISLPAQAPLVLYGNSSWTFRDVEPNGSVSIEPRIYAPSSSIGATFAVTLTVSYSDIYGRSFTETHNTGLVVRGLINFVVYDVNVTPNPAYPGSTVTITATLLNKGNLAATNVNASIQSNPVLTLYSLSTFYIDQIDKNSPEPLSLKAHVNPGLANGTYPVTLTISYMDDQLTEHSISITAYVTVTQKTGDSMGQSEETSLVT
ncbi:MAG: PKD domain-containing protein, partial [Nitrososphaerota archaeon]